MLICFRKLMAFTGVALVFYVCLLSYNKPRMLQISGHTYFSQVEGFRCPLLKSTKMADNMASIGVTHFILRHKYFAEKFLSYLYSPLQVKRCSFLLLKAFSYGNKNRKYKTAFALLLKMSFLKQSALFGCLTQLWRCLQSTF